MKTMFATWTTFARLHSGGVSLGCLFGCPEPAVDDLWYPVCRRMVERAVAERVVGRGAVPLEVLGLVPLSVPLAAVAFTTYHTLKNGYKFDVEGFMSEAAALRRMENTFLIVARENGCEILPEAEAVLVRRGIGGRVAYGQKGGGRRPPPF